MSILKKNGCNQLFPLHCVANYPAENDELYLNKIQILSKKLDCEVGYSDHSIGIFAPIVAASMGASIIEKHFTTNKKLPGGDNEISIDENELKEMIEGIRKISKIKGIYRDDFSKAEKKTKKLISRKFFSKSLIKKGEQLDIEKIVFLRTDSDVKDAFSGSELDLILKSKSNLDILPYKMIKKKDLCQI